MKRFLDSRLADPELSIDHLVQAFRCSRSTVFRLFQEIGGVQRYIRDQRLAQCFRELTQPSSSPKRIHQLAGQWGFQDAHHFSRLFKRQFGLTPSEAAETAKRPAGELSVSGSSLARDHIATLHGWLGRR